MSPHSSSRAGPPPGQTRGSLQGSCDIVIQCILVVSFGIFSRLPPGIWSWLTSPPRPPAAVPLQVRHGKLPVEIQAAPGEAAVTGPVESVKCCFVKLLMFTLVCLVTSRDFLGVCNWYLARYSLSGVHVAGVPIFQAPGLVWVHVWVDLRQ